MYRTKKKKKKKKQKQKKKKTFISNFIKIIIFSYKLKDLLRLWL